jgi:hypothetical protein
MSSFGLPGAPVLNAARAEAGRNHAAKSKKTAEGEARSSLLELPIKPQIRSNPGKFGCEAAPDRSEAEAPASGPAQLAAVAIHCYGARAHRLCPMSRRLWGKATRRTQEPQTSWRFRQGGGSSAATRSNSSTRRAATPATSHAWGPQPIEPETPRKPAIPAPGLAPAIRQRDSACPPCRYGAHPSWPGCLARLRPCLKAVPCGRQARYADSAALARRCARRLARRWR